MTDNYQDPENIDEIIEELKRSKTIENVVDLINRVYPTWILYYLRKYSEDYPHLQSNWENYCNEQKVRPAHIMIINEFLIDKNHTLIGVFAELFTICGFIVRTPKKRRNYNKGLNNENYEEMIGEVKSLSRRIIELELENKKLKSKNK